MARVFTVGTPGDDGRRPNDDVAGLIELRNWLVHYKPETIYGENELPSKAWKHLPNRFAANRIFDGLGNVSSFPFVTLSAGCARWAVESVQGYIDEFVAATGIDRTTTCSDPMCLWTHWAEAPATSRARTADVVAQLLGGSPAPSAGRTTSPSRSRTSPTNLAIMEAGVVAASGRRLSRLG